LGKAARATRAVSSGTGGISIGFSDMVSLPESASANLNSTDLRSPRCSDEFANGIIIGTQIYGRVS
jgi:hypothetical protein